MTGKSISITGKTTAMEYLYNSNPAQLIGGDNFLGISYSPSVFNIPSLSPAFVSGYIELTNDVGLGLNSHYMGNDIFDKFGAGILTSVRIFENLKGGFELIYSRLRIKNNTDDSKFEFNVGFILDISDRLSAAISLINLNNSFYQYGEEYSDRKVIIGAGYSLDSNLSVEIACLINPAKQTAFSTNLLYSLNNWLIVKAGYISYPSSLDFDFRVKMIENLALSVGLNYHSFLGLRKIISLSFLW